MFEAGYEQIQDEIILKENIYLYNNKEVSLRVHTPHYVKCIRFGFGECACDPDNLCPLFKRLFIVKNKQIISNYSLKGSQNESLCCDVM